LYPLHDLFNLPSLTYRLGFPGGKIIIKAWSEQVGDVIDQST
jgi:hypothetical protein